MQVVIQQDRDRQEEELIRSRAARTLKDVEYTTSLRLLTIMSCMGGVEFSAVLPSLWQYTQRITLASAWWAPMQVQLIAMVGFYTATTLTKPSIGCLIDSGMAFRRGVGWITLFGGAGGLLYALAGSVGSHGVPLLILARFVGGGGNAMSTLANLYTLRALEGPRQKQQMSYFAAASLIGVFVGPAVVPLFATVHDVRLGPLLFDECTLPGWFLFVVFMALGAANALHVREPPARPTGSAELGTNHAAVPATEAAVAVSAPTATPTARWSLLGLAIIYALTILFTLNMFSFISVLAVLTEQQWGWGPVPNAYLFLCLAGFTLTGVLISGQLLGAGVPPTTMLAVSALMLCVHLLLIGVWPACLARLDSFLVWTSLAGVSYAALNSSNNAAVAASAPPSSVGLCIGLLGFVDSGGSAVAPLYLNMFGVRGAEHAAIVDVLRASRLTMLPLAALVSLGCGVVLLRHHSTAASKRELS